MPLRVATGSGTRTSGLRALTTGWCPLRNRSSGEPPVRVYDTSGPYTDPNVKIDISTGLAQLRRQWQLDRGDIEEYEAREVKPEDNGQLGPDRSGGVPAYPNVRKTVYRAKPGKNLSQMHYARQGIITPEMEYVAERENLGRAALKEVDRDGGESCWDRRRSCRARRAVPKPSLQRKGLEKEQGRWPHSQRDGFAPGMGKRCGHRW